MAKECLAIPEEHLPEVIYVIRTGLNKIKHSVKNEVYENLTKWCNETEKYLKD